MRICPNCGKEVADDAAHCGHCGHQLEQDHKKTMMGLGVVDAEALREQYAKAKAQREGATAHTTSAASPEDEELPKTELLDAVSPATPQGAQEASTGQEESAPDVTAEEGPTLESPPASSAMAQGAGDMPDGEQGSSPQGGRWEIGEPEPQQTDGGALEPGELDEEEGSNKKMFIIIGAVALVFLFCCVGGTLVSLFTGAIGGG